MISISLYEQIRHLYAVEKLSQRAIARKLGISRNTVKRYCQGENMPWEDAAENLTPEALHLNDLAGLASIL